MTLMFNQFYSAWRREYPYSLMHTYYEIKLSFWVLMPTRPQLTKTNHQDCYFTTAILVSCIKLLHRMEHRLLKMLCFLLRGVLLLQLMYFINQHQFGADANQSELFDRMTKIESKNLKQDNEISLLKMKSIEDRREINELRERVAHLEESQLKNLTTEYALDRPKRPVRLLPPRLF